MNRRILNWREKVLGTIYLSEGKFDRLPALAAELVGSRWRTIIT